MKAGLAVIIALALGALAATFLLQDIGYVLINFRGVSLEMSVPVLVLLMVLAYLAVRICTHILRAPRRLGELAAQRRQRKAGERITRGYIELGEGNFARGEKLLTKGVRNSDTPLLNYLAAARAAQAQGDKERRDNWLRMAYEQDPRASAAVLLTQAELQLANDEVETCRATLNKVLEMTPNNIEALRLKTELCVLRSDWDELQRLLPILRKKGHVADAVIDDWFVQTWCALLAVATDDPGRIRELWKQLPRHLRDQPQLIHARVNSLIADGQLSEAEKNIRKALDKNWSEELVLLYGQLDADTSSQLRHAEGWLHSRPEDPALLLTAARLCVRNELWGKARSYFETSNAIRPSAETWHDMGKLMLRIGDYEAASNSFQQGLTLNYAGADVPRLEDQLGSDPN
jgi:HemY protein